jgi:hypothetical protein
MRTSGRGNDTVLLFVPVLVTILAGVIIAGGPAEAAQSVTAFLRDAAHDAVAFVNSLF